MRTRNWSVLYRYSDTTSLMCNFLIYWLHFIQWLSVVLIIVNIVFIVCCVVSSQKIDKLLGEFTKEDEDAIAEELECIQV